MLAMWRNPKLFNRILHILGFFGKAVQKIINFGNVFIQVLYIVETVLKIWIGGCN